jgi:hypothetical protein
MIPMPAQTTNLFRLQDLENSSGALRTVADWIKSSVARPHKDLGRAGPVCPFVPGALERRTLWLAAERIASRSEADLVQLIEAYKKLLLRAQPIEGEDTSYKAIVVVFTDVSADRAKESMEGVQVQRLKRLSYVEDGVVMGDFHARNEGSAIRNPNFQPFKAPVPFLLMRHGVVGDWMFFLDNEEWLGFWARRFGESAVEALAAELRNTNWRQSRRDPNFSR